MLVYYMYAFYYLPWRESLLQEKEYNWEISYQMNKGICFNIYKSAYSDNIA